MNTAFCRLASTPAERVWIYAFAALLAARLLLPVYNGPMDNLFSDMERHWNNARSLLNPPLWGGIDSKFYQLYLYILSWLGQNKDGPVNFYTGLLSAGTAYVWYRAGRELYGRTGGLKLGLLIGAYPSLWLIFSYFMNETLLLFMFGLSFWLTFRAMRRQDRLSGWQAAAAWVLTAFTRVIALPVSLAALWFLLVYLRDRRSFLDFTLSMLCICVTLAGWHSMAGMRVFAPFGFTLNNAVYHYSGTQRYGVETETAAQYHFMCPSFVYNHWAPFGKFTSCRSKEQLTFGVNTRRGVESWEEVLQTQKDLFTPHKFWCNFWENQQFLWIGHSWPDSRSRAKGWLASINLHSRWLWPPLLLMMIWTFFRRPLSRPEWLIVCCGCGLLFALTFQQTGVMEGRFRKPMEPLALWTVFALFWRGERRLMPETLRWYQFLREAYLAPLVRWPIAGWRRLKR